MKPKETTEKKFKDFCSKRNIYSQKLRVPLELDRIGINKAQRYPCDYIVVIESKVLFVEIKEVLYEKSFPLSRLTQEYSLFKLSEINKNCLGMVLINFVSEDKIAYLNIFEYLELARKINKKSLNVVDFPEKFIFNWKTLIV